MEKTPTPKLEPHGQCSECRWCGADGAINLVCRIRPATLQAALVVGQNGMPQWMAAYPWPVVGKTDWCKEFDPAAGKH